MHGPFLKAAIRRTPLTMAAWSFPGQVAVLWPIVALAGPPEPCSAYPSLPYHGRALSDFVPRGWQIEAQVGGELKDAGPLAAAVVFKKAGSSSPQADSACDDQRILAVLLESPAQGYSLAVQNHTLIPMHSAQDQEFADVALGDGAKVPPLEIKRGSLLVHISLVYRAYPIAGEDLTYTFRYRDRRLYLVGYDALVASQVSISSVIISYNFLTGRAHLSSEAEDCAGPTDVAAGCSSSAWKRIKRQSLLTIDEVGDGANFRPPAY